MFNRKYPKRNKKHNLATKNTLGKTTRGFISQNSRISGGFTLIEMIVSIGIFAIVMTLSLGALLIMNDALRKTRLMKNAIENAHVSIELMSKKIRVGANYHCGDPMTITEPRNCPYTGNTNGGDSYLAFVDEGDIVEYQWNKANPAQGKPTGTIETRRCTSKPTSSCNGNSQPWKVITTPDIDITGLKFYVENAEDTTPPYTQPLVTISINGRASLPGKSTLDTNFHIQTTVSQRIIDLSP